MSNKDPRMARIEAVAMEWLTKLNREDLSDEQQQEFFQWLETSPLHQAAYINAEDLWQRGEALTRVSDSAPARPWVEMRWGWAFAMSFLFVIGAWLIFPKTPEQQQYASVFGEQKSIVLEDGSRLLLNSDTAVSIRLESSARVAELHKGEVFFEVAPDAQRPFSVMTAQGLVRVVGTRFSVHQLAHDAMVTVLEGKVALGETVPSGKDFQAKQVLKANQRLSLNEARAGQAPADVEAQNLLAWRDRQLIFKGRPLVEVTRELERYFAVEISFATPDLANREITAVIQLSDQKTTLNQLALALGLTWDDGSKQGQLRLVDKSPPSVD
jgi:transmembrane sensor